MHHWVDSDFDWEGLGKAMGYIESEGRKRTKMNLVMKEKYGTIRYETIFWDFSQDPQVRSRQMEVIKTIVWEAVDRYPHLEDEIMSHASIELDFPKEIQDKYWESE